MLFKILLHGLGGPLFKLGLREFLVDLGLQMLRDMFVKLALQKHEKLGKAVIFFVGIVVEFETFHVEGFEFVHFSQTFVLLLKYLIERGEGINLALELLDS